MAHADVLAEVVKNACNQWLEKHSAAAAGRATAPGAIVTDAVRVNAATGTAHVRRLLCLASNAHQYVALTPDDIGWIGPYLPVALTE